MPNAPETSTVRSALTALGAIEDALDVRYPQASRLESVATAIRASRELRPHQLDELLDYLDGRAAVAEPDTLEDSPER